MVKIYLSVASVELHCLGNTVYILDSSYFTITSSCYHHFNMLVTSGGSTEAARIRNDMSYSLSFAHRMEGG